MFCLYLCWFNVRSYIHLCCIHEICLHNMSHKSKLPWMQRWYNADITGVFVSLQRWHPRIQGWLRLPGEIWKWHKITQTARKPPTLFVLCSSQFIIQELTLSMFLILLLSPHVPSGNHSSMVSCIGYGCPCFPGGLPPSVEKKRQHTWLWAYNQYQPAGSLPFKLYIPFSFLFIIVS